MDHAVKFVDGHDDIIEGMLAPFGGPEYLGGKDLDGEFFTPLTDFVLDWFADWERPLLYAHGLDGAIKTSVVGRFKVEPTEKGLWMRAQLDKAHEYYDVIAGLIKKTALGLSSGSVTHLVEVDESGMIKRWPLIEGSLTPTPSNPDAAPVRYAAKSADIAEHLAVLGVALPPEAMEPTGDHAITIEQPEPEPPAIEAIKSALTPQALHDAAVASGAVCAGEMKANPEPVRLLAVAGKSTEQEAPAIDLERFAAELTELAIREAKSMLA